MIFLGGFVSGRVYVVHMKLSEIRQTRNPWAIAGILIAAQLVQIYVISWLPIFDWDSQSNWPVYQYRMISMAFSVALVWLFVPNALRMFRFRVGGYPKIFTTGIFLALFAASLIYGAIQSYPVLATLDAAIFSIFIGLDEEFFNRVFVFGILQRFGFEIALTISALIFGAAHFTNFIYGDESFNYVLGHVISAAGFGYFMAVLMYVTGSVWVPVALHGLTDLRWVTMDMSDYSTIVSGGTNWISVLFATTVFIGLSRITLALHHDRLHPPKSWMGTLRWFGLVE